MMDQRSQMVLRTYRNTSRLVGYVLKYITIRDLKYVYPFEGLQTQIGGVSVQYRNVGPQHHHKSGSRFTTYLRRRRGETRELTNYRLRYSSAGSAVGSLSKYRGGSSCKSSCVLYFGGRKVSDSMLDAIIHAIPPCLHLQYPPSPSPHSAIPPYLSPSPF